MEDVSKKIILIVDDVSENIEILGNLLSPNYQIKVALNGFDALLIANGDEQPDLILLDIMMPLMDGYDVCRSLKANPKTKDIPVVFISALTSEIDEYAGLELGAIDYINKLYSPRLVEVRVRNILECREAQQKLHQALSDLQEYQRNESMITAEIQKTLLLARPPVGLERVQFGSFSKYSHGADGNFFDFFPIHARSFYVLFGEVMGKGILASLIGAATRYNFQRAISRLLIAAPDRSIPTPEAIVKAAHEDMALPLDQVNRFISLHFARFEIDEELLHLVVCSETPMLRLRNSDKSCHEFNSKHDPHAQTNFETCLVRQITIEPGDLFLFFSNGMINALNPQGESFGLQRLKEFICANQDKAPQQLLADLEATLQKFIQTESFSDNVTALAIRLASNDTESQRTKP